jgi:hypothetical protein
MSTSAEVRIGSFRQNFASRGCGHRWDRLGEKSPPTRPGPADTLDFSQTPKPKGLNFATSRRVAVASQLVAVQGRQAPQVFEVAGGRVDLRHKLCADRTDSGQVQLRLHHLGRCRLLFLGQVVCQRGLHRSGFAEHLHQRRGCSSRRESCSTPSTPSGVAGPAYWMLREIRLRREFCQGARRVIGTMEAVIPRAVSKPYESAAETLSLGFASAGSRRAPGQLTKDAAVWLTICPGGKEVSGREYFLGIAAWNLCEPMRRFY